MPPNKLIPVKTNVINVKLLPLSENKTEGKVGRTKEKVEPEDNTIASIKKKAGRPKTKKERPKRVKLSEEEKKIRLKLSKQKSRAKLTRTICTICGKFVKNMLTHMKLHEVKEKGENVECDYCKQIFTHKLQLTGHFRTHFTIR